MGASVRTHLLPAALMLTLFACSGCDGGGARWPEVNSGCGHVKLHSPGEESPEDYEVIRSFTGHWDTPDKDLRAWLINKACAAGADAVVDVIQTKGTNGDGAPVWNIRGTAVVWKH